MRISIDSSNIGHALYDSNQAHRLATVLFNGVPLQNVITADEECGLALVIETDKNNHVILGFGDRPRTKWLAGVVKIVLYEQKVEQKVEPVPQRLMPEDDITEEAEELVAACKAGCYQITSNSTKDMQRILADFVAIRAEKAKVTQERLSRFLSGPLPQDFEPDDYNSLMKLVPVNTKAGP